MLNRILIRAIFAVVLVVLSAVSGVAAGPKIKTSDMVSIAQDKTTMHAGPGEKRPVLWELGRGVPLRIIDTQGTWLKLTDFEHDVGWVAKKQVSREPYFIVKANGNRQARISLRKGPGPKQEVVGEAAYGVVLKNIARKKEWVKVRHESGLTGWVRRDQLWGW
ncbi:MAG: hypothetical protein A2521_06385 [Deltaproteobacteria bacterium RIFOXYD12_FULL_57_12]|nr:MAG: hypothetical protein A2521_06385 [Deltaproteobacteria bacterium RIFOXYD12_FULL_57_12]